MCLPCCFLLFSLRLSGGVACMQGVAHSIPLPIKGEAYKIEMDINFPQVVGWLGGWVGGSREGARTGWRPTATTACVQLPRGACIRFEVKLLALGWFMRSQGGAPFMKGNEPVGPVAGLGGGGAALQAAFPGVDFGVLRVVDDAAKTVAIKNTGKGRGWARTCLPGARVLFVA